MRADRLPMDGDIAARQWWLRCSGFSCSVIVRFAALPPVSVAVACTARPMSGGTVERAQSGVGEVKDDCRPFAA